MGMSTGRTTIASRFDAAAHSSQPPSDSVRIKTGDAWTGAVSKTGGGICDQYEEIEEGEIVFDQGKDRAARRLAQLKRRFGPLIAKYNYALGEPRSTAKPESHPSVGQVRKKARLCKLTNQMKKAREESRQAMNAMTKTVEIADGSADLVPLMKGAFGELPQALDDFLMGSDFLARKLGLRLKSDDYDIAAQGK